jgi:hypothetical protein
MEDQNRFYLKNFKQVTVFAHFVRLSNCNYDSKTKCKIGLFRNVYVADRDTQTILFYTHIYIPIEENILFHLRHHNMSLFRFSAHVRMYKKRNNIICYGLEKIEELVNYGRLYASLNIKRKSYMLCDVSMCGKKRNKRLNLFIFYVYYYMCIVVLCIAQYLFPIAFGKF